MSNLFPFLIVFIIALGIGVFIGKIIFSARFQTDKISLEEKLLALNNQLATIKEQIQIDKSNFEKQLSETNKEKESIRTEKDSLANQLSKKEVDL